jgi:hypothetical protein
MTHSVEKALTELKNIGSVDSIRTLAEKNPGADAKLKVNSHIHLPPNFSAFETVDQAVKLAAEQNMDVVGVSNYYDFQVYGDFVAKAKSKNIFPLFGLEIIALLDDLVKTGVKINDPGNPGKMYICGKGITKFDKMSEKAREIMGLIRKNDSERMAKMIQLMAKIFAEHGVDTKLDENAVKEMIVKRHGCSKELVYIQERHIAQAFQEAFFTLVPETARISKMTEIFGKEPKAGPTDAVKVQNEIRSHLMKAGKPAFVQETFVNFEQAYQLILELGGIPCYPTLADGVLPICGFEDPVETLIANIKSRNIHAAEFIPLRNQPDVLVKYVKAMRAAGLVVLGGTEHNTLDLIPFEPECLKCAAVPEEIKDIFREGACVAAAHQFLTLNGEAGFVDGKGNLNPKYKTDEERITSLRKIGEAVIAKYRGKTA